MICQRDASARPCNYSLRLSSDRPLFLATLNWAVIYEPPPPLLLLLFDEIPKTTLTVSREP